jgi:hypothetical protein
LRPQSGAQRKADQSIACVEPADGALNIPPVFLAFDQATLPTAAHKSLPFGSKVKITNKKSGDAVTVTIADRGPHVKGRCIDLSKAGASALGFAGPVPVSIVLGCTKLPQTYPAYCGAR